MNPDRGLLEAALAGYQLQHSQILSRIDEIRRELKQPVRDLAIVSIGRVVTGKQGHGELKKQRLSAAGSRHIAEANRKRWAAYRAQKEGAAKVAS